MRMLSLFATTLLSCGVASCQESRGVRARASGPEQVTARPGEIVVAAFTITNDNDGAERFLEALALPAGWQPIQPLADFPLGPRASESRLVSFAVPRTAEAATYTITYSIRSQHNRATQDQATLTVVVAAVSKLEALTDSRSLTTAADGSWEARVQVVNRGNSPVSLHASCQGEAADEVTIQPADFTLNAGAQQVVVVRGGVAGSEPRSRSLTVPVVFCEAQNAASPVLASVRFSVTVLAAQSGETDMNRHLPTTLALRLSGGPGGDAVQAEWSGRGALDDEGKRTVSFLLRGPDTRDSGIFGLQSEGRLSYSDPSVDVSLGNQSYGLSYLTEYLGYGCGAGLQWRLGESDQATLYSYRETDSALRPSHTGLRLGHRLGRDWLVATNLLARRSEVDALSPTADDGEIASLELSGQSARGTQVRFEVGQSRSNVRGSDTAYDLEARGTLGNGGTYSLHKLRAGADYAGHVHDLDRSSVSLSAPLAARLRVSGSFSEYRGNLEHRSGSGGAPVERLWGAGLDYQLADGWSAGVTHHSYRQRDAMGTADTGSDDQALGLVVARSDERSSLRAVLSQGRHQDLSTGAVTRPWGLDLMGVYREGSRCTLTAFGGLGQDRVYDGGAALGQSRHSGFSLDWQARPDLSCSVWYTDQRPAALFNADSVQAQALLAYRPRPGESWELQVRRSSFAEGPAEVSYALTYSVPIALTIGRRRDVGALSGRLFETQDPLHPGLAGATVVVDQQAVRSDAQGRFMVGGLRPGKHRVQIDRASLGLQRVTTVPTPLEIEITGGKTTSLELGLVTAARVAGVLRLVPAVSTAGDEATTGAPRDPASAGPASLAGVLIELVGDGETRQSLSDAAGRFGFDGLRPGTWCLKVATASLPPQHYAEQPSTVLVLQPGQCLEAKVAIAERVRRIRMLTPAGQGTLSSAP